MDIRPFFMARDVGRKHAGILRYKPTSIKWSKDHGKEPKRAKQEYPWFWDGDEFTAKRVNDIHLSIESKRKARHERG